jgi:DNA-binding response OmpR family regulator
MAIAYLSGEGIYANRDLYPIPSLVLLDLKLPYVTGLDVLEWIRHNAPVSVPVVILSSSENENDISAAYDRGANAYLVKPSDTSQFLTIARTIKEFWLMQNRIHPNVGKAGEQRLHGHRL